MIDLITQNDLLNEIREALTVVREQSNIRQRVQGQFARCVSTVATLVQRLLLSFDSDSFGDLETTDELLLLEAKKNTVILLGECFALLSSKRRFLGQAIQRLLVDIYDAANDSVHYEREDEVFQSYKNIINDVVGETLRIFTELKPIDGAIVYMKTFMPWIQEIPAPIRKAAKRYFRDECEAFHSAKVHKVLFEPKEEGKQMGVKAIVYFEEDIQPPVTFHVKTHQHYAAQSSDSPYGLGTPSSSHAIIDLKELFVYKALECMGVGPKVHFIIHHGQADTTFNKNALFIATQDVGYSRVHEKRKTFQQVGRLFAIAPESSAQTDSGFRKELQSELDSDQVTPTKVAATIIDLIARIFRLRDLNGGNIGKVRIIHEGERRTKWKLIDFVINKLPDYKIGDMRAVTEGFINGNGTLDYSGVEFLSMILLGRSRIEKIDVGCDAMQMLAIGMDRQSSRTSLENAIGMAFEYVQQFMEMPRMATPADVTADDEDASTITNSVALGIPADALIDLKRYRDDVLYNFHTIRQGLSEANVYAAVPSISLGIGANI